MLDLLVTTRKAIAAVTVMYPSLNDEGKSQVLNDLKMLITDMNSFAEQCGILAVELEVITHKLEGERYDS